MRTPHTSCPRGKRVRVVLKDGTEFVDKFMEHTAGHLVIFAAHQVRQGDIKIFTILRAKAR